MAKFWELVGLPPPEGEEETAAPIEPVEPQQAEKGWGQTLYEAGSTGLEVMEAGVASLAGASPETQAEQISQIGKFKPSKEQEDWNVQRSRAAGAIDAAEGFGETVAAVWDFAKLGASNPKMVAADVTQAATMSVPGIIAGAAAGAAAPAVGVPVTIARAVSFLLGSAGTNVSAEVAGEITETLVERGIDPNNQIAVDAAIRADPDIFAEPITKGVKGGLATTAVEAPLDVLTFKALSSLTKAKDMKQGLARGAVAGGVQGVGEGTGSIASSLAKGEDPSYGEALYEGVIGSVASLPEVAAMTYAARTVREVMDPKKTLDEAIDAATKLAANPNAEVLPPDPELVATRKTFSEATEEAQKLVDAEDASVVAAVKEVMPTATPAGVADPPPGVIDAAAGSANARADVGQAVSPSVLQPAAGLPDRAVDPVAPGPGAGAGDRVDVGGGDRVQPVGDAGVAPADVAPGVQPGPGPDAVAAQPAAADAAVAQDPVAPLRASLELEAEQRRAAGDATAVAAPVKAVDETTLPDVRTENDDGTFTLSKKEAGGVHRMAKLFGRKAVFFEGSTDEGAVIGGDADTIYVNTRAKSAHHLVVAGHEIAHQMRVTAPKIYAKLQKNLVKGLTEGDWERFSAYYGNMAEADAAGTYEKLRVSGNLEKLTHEFIADLVGNRAGELKTFTRMFAKTERDRPGLLVQIGEFIVDFIDRLLERTDFKKFKTDEYVKDLQRAKKEIRESLTEFANQVNTGNAKERLQEKVDAIKAKRPGATPAPAPKPGPITRESGAATKSPERDDEPPKPKSLQEFSKSIGDQVRTRVEYGRMLARQHEWAYNVGDRLISTKTGEVFEIKDRSFSPEGPIRRGVADQRKWTPQYVIESRTTQTTAREKALLESKTMKSLNRPTGDVTRSTRRTGDGTYFSQLEKAVEDGKQKVMPAIGWAQWLAGNAPKLGVKKEELEWTGVIDWLQMKKGERVEKEALLTYLREKGVQIEIVSMSDEEAAEEVSQAEIDEEVERRIQAERESLQDDSDIDEEIERRRERWMENFESSWTYPSDLEEVPLRDDNGDPVLDDDDEPVMVERYVVRPMHRYRYRADEYEDAEFFEDEDSAMERYYELTDEEADEAWSREERDIRNEIENDRENQIDEDQIREDVIDEMGGRKRVRTKFGNWRIRVAGTPEQLPGGANYTEMLLRLPDLGVNFDQSHWRETNVLAHVRFDERLDTDGNKVLFIQEIQSDWAQKGRERGFKKEPDPKLQQAMEDASDKIAELRNDRERFRQQVNDHQMMTSVLWDEAQERVRAAREKRRLAGSTLAGDLRPITLELEELDPADRETIRKREAIDLEMQQQYEAMLAPLVEARVAFAKAQQALKASETTLKLTGPPARAEQTGLGLFKVKDKSGDLIAEIFAENESTALDRAVDFVPSANSSLDAGPMLKDTGDWVTLALKRILKVAVDYGFDRVVLPTGAQIADVYGMRHQVDKITLAPVTGAYNGAFMEAWRGDAAAATEFIRTAEDLREHVGRELADTLLKQYRETGQASVEGEALDMGGAGHAEFYDKIVPQTANKLLRKLDDKAKVGRVKVSEEGVVDAGETPQLPLPGFEPGGPAAVPEGNGTVQPVITITPKMKAAVEAGMPLFSKQRGEPGVDKDRLDKVVANSSLGGSVRATPGVNVKRMMQLLGPKLYGSLNTMQNTTIKEMFQNSFDAVKGMQQRNPGVEGVVDIAVDKDARTVTFVDNGTGMTPAVLGKEFLQIAGTNKETDRASGGLGIAKMQFLFGNESLEVMTWRDGRLSVLRGRGAEMIESMDDPELAPEIEVTENVTLARLREINPTFADRLPGDATSGTWAQIVVPKTYEDPADKEQKDISFNDEHYDFPVLRKSPLFEPVQVRWRDSAQVRGGRPESYRQLYIGAEFPISEYVPFADVKFPWGSARVYVTREEEAWPDRENMIYLSNGIYQFGEKLNEDPMDMWSKPVKRTVYVDINSAVRPEDSGYPFDLNRQQFSPQTKEAMQQLKNYLWLAYKKNEIAGSVENFGALQYVRPDGTATTERVIAPPPVEGAIADQKLEEGTELEVRDGKFYVSGQELKVLKPEDLKKARIDYDAFKIPQSEIDPSLPIIHDNIEVTYQGPTPEGEQAIYGERIPLVVALRREFGDERVNRAMAGFGKVMSDVRASLVNLHGYQKEFEGDGVGLGVSLDTEYHGVHVYLPFRMITVNPASFNWAAHTELAANRVWTTIVHEFAHTRAKNHNNEFIRELQDLMALMEISDGPLLRRELVAHAREYADILRRAQEYFDGSNNSDPKTRGRRLPESGYEPVAGRDTGAVDRSRRRAGGEQAVPGDAAVRAEQAAGPESARSTARSGRNSGVDDGNTVEAAAGRAAQARAGGPGGAPAAGGSAAAAAGQRGPETGRGAGRRAGSQAGLGGDGAGRAGQRRQDEGGAGAAGRAARGVSTGAAGRSGRELQLPLDGRDERAGGQGRSTGESPGGSDDRLGPGAEGRLEGVIDRSPPRAATPGSTWAADPVKVHPLIEFANKYLPAKWQIPNNDSVIRTLLNKQIDLKRTQQAIASAGRAINDAFNAVQKEMLYHGRVADQILDFHQREMQPLLKAMSDAQITQQMLDTFLWNRAAEGYNRHINRINDDPKLRDKGSGIHTNDARRYLAALTPEERATYERLAGMVDDLTKGTREHLVLNGMEKRATIEAWERTFPNYVPLQRGEVEEQVIGDGSGRGFSAPGPFAKPAMGSEKPVVDVLANIIMQRERAIVRVEKTTVGRSFFGLAVQNPNEEFWRVIDPVKDMSLRRQMLIDMGIDPANADLIANKPTEKYKDADGYVRRRVNSRFTSAKNVFAVRVNGEDKYVLLNARNAQAMNLASALNNLDPDVLNKVLGIFQIGSRWFASINTQWNVIFGAVNLVRDTGAAMANLSTTPIAGEQLAVMGNIRAAWWGIIKDARNPNAPSQNNAWSLLYRDFRKHGGKTGYRDMFQNSAERAADIHKELSRFTANKGVKGWRWTFQLISDYNDAMENAVRLSAYKVGIDKGMTKEAAAVMSKNLTVNFNQKGKVATQAGALYAFFNASAQGSARLYETLKGPRGGQIIMGGLAVGALQAAMLAAAGFEDDEPPEFIKQRNFIIPNLLDDDGKGYFMIPMPLGLHVLPNFSRMMVEFMMGGFKRGPEKLTEFLGLVADAFNPVGNAGLSLQTITPTVIDPFAALAENRDFAGRPISREDFNSLKPTPGHTRARDTASYIGVGLSQALNWMSGGTQYKPGTISPTPDQIDYLFGQLTGGVGRELLKTQSVISSARTGEELPYYKKPLLGRFYGENTGAPAESARFYENVKEINKHKAEVDGRKKDGQDPSSYMKANPEVFLEPLARSVQKQVSDLRKVKKKMIARGAPTTEIRVIENQIAATMKRLNDRVLAAQE